MAVVFIEINVVEGSTYSSVIVKDYGAFKKYIYFKTAIKKEGFEENEDFSKTSDFELYVDENEINADGYKFPNAEKDIRFTDLENKERATRRSKQKIFDMAFLNDWDYFITLTFDKKKVGDRKDLDCLKKKTLQTFKDWTKKYNIKYLLIPELHKDGALHWHGLLRDLNNRIILEKTKDFTDGGREIYNIKSWADYKGFNTAVKISKDIESRSKVSSYISKYISKGEDKIFDKYYYCSNGLVNSPKVEYLDSVPLDFFLGEVFENAQCYIKTVC